VINFRIRGIYSTALASLLLDKDFRIVQPSAKIRERFNLPRQLEKNLPLGLDIYDRLDRQGINAVGDEGSVKAFAQLLRSTFDDVVVRQRVSTYAGTNSSYTRANLEIASHETSLEVETSSSARKVSLNIEFPGSSKKKLDGLRAMVTSTLDGHNHYKACGGRISSLLHMAEKMLEKDCSRKEVEALFKETIEREYPQEGSRINLEHVKVDGKVFDLGTAEITEFDKKNGRIKLLRTFIKKGLYDGLKTRKSPGDYAVTEMKLGDWSFRTRYYSKDGKYKGTYVNINTPIELYPSSIRYVDLEADVCLWPDGKIREIDKRKLEEMIHAGYVSEKLGRIVSEKIEEVLGSLSLNAEKNSS
jgi:hypothetical protein